MLRKPRPVEGDVIPDTAILSYNANRGRMMVGESTFEKPRSKGLVYPVQKTFYTVSSLHFLEDYNTAFGVLGYVR